MRTIHKYPILPTDFILTMPRNAKLVHFGVHKGVPCMWAEVDTDEPQEKRKFGVFRTGKPIGDLFWCHVATIVIADGTIVLHLYEYIDTLADSLIAELEKNTEGKIDA